MTIDRQMLAAQTLPSGLKQIMSLVILAANFIKITDFKFKNFHQDLLSNQPAINTTPYRGHRVVRGQSLELHEELAVFFIEK
jgi:hypothetical protein